MSVSLRSTRTSTSRRSCGVRSLSASFCLSRASAVVFGGFGDGALGGGVGFDGGGVGRVGADAVLDEFVLALAGVVGAGDRVDDAVVGVDDALLGFPDAEDLVGEVERVDALAFAARRPRDLLDGGDQVLGPEADVGELLEHAVEALAGEPGFLAEVGEVLFGLFEGELGAFAGEFGVGDAADRVRGFFGGVTPRPVGVDGGGADTVGGVDGVALRVGLRSVGVPDAAGAFGDAVLARL